MAWLLVACLWSLPVCVWSAPPGIPPVDALSDSAAAASRRYPEPPDPLEDTPGYPPERAPDVVHPALNPPGGPPPPFPVRREIPTLPRQTVPVVVRDVVCGAYVLSPGYQPEAVTFRLGVPCDAEDLVAEATRHLRQLRLPFCNCVMPVQASAVTKLCNAARVPGLGCICCGFGCLSGLAGHASRRQRPNH